MTPGQEALIEAMRIEQARIYGQLDEAAREHLAARQQQESSHPPAVIDIAAARRRKRAA